MGSVWGRLRKGSVASASTSFMEKASHLALTLISDNSVSFFISLVSLVLLPLFWSSDRVVLVKFVHRPFKRNCQDPQKPSISFSPLVFTARNYEDFSS